MRFVDLSKLPIPAEWGDEERHLLGELAAMSSKERSEAFKKEKYRVWALWSRLLEGLSHGKCWYSELRVTGAAGDIDHFRPKNKVAKEDAPEGHDGYWWLGILLNNFRFCCQLSNRRIEDEETGEIQGKGTRFPLFDRNTRAREGTDPLDRERPLLLDPTVKSDTELLWFNQDGSISSRNPDKDSLDYRRVEASRLCYHLDDVNIRTRRGTVCAEVKRIAETLEELENGVAGGNGDARRKLIERKIKLLEMTREYAEFSAAARATLKAYDYIPSAKEVLAS